MPDTGTALKKLDNKGFKIFVVSNQAGVSKGLYSQNNLDLITRNMLAELNKNDINISGVYYCTHRSEDNCTCRKPKTGMVERAIVDLKKKGHVLDMPGSYFVGDSEIDIQTGKAAGLKTILLFSGKEKPGNKTNWRFQPDFTAKNLSEAVDIIIEKIQ